MVTHTFWYSQTSQSLNLRKKVANLYGVSNDFYLKPLPLKRVFLNLTAKAVSVTMIVKNEKMTPKITCPFTHFLEI